jgi:hypothetical protein
MALCFYAWKKIWLDQISRHGSKLAFIVFVGSLLASGLMLRPLETKHRYDWSQ